MQAAGNGSFFFQGGLVGSLSSGAARPPKRKSEEPHYKEDYEDDDGMDIEEREVSKAWQHLSTHLRAASVRRSIKTSVNLFLLLQRHQNREPVPEMPTHKRPNLAAKPPSVPRAANQPLYAHNFSNSASAPSPSTVTPTIQAPALNGTNHSGAEIPHHHRYHQISSVVPSVISPDQPMTMAMAASLGHVRRQSQASTNSYDTLYMADTDMPMMEDPGTPAWEPVDEGLNAMSTSAPPALSWHGNKMNQ